MPRICTTTPTGCEMAPLLPSAGVPLDANQMKGRSENGLAVDQCSVHRAGEVLGPHDGQNLFRGGRVCSEPRRLSQVSTQ